MKKNKQFPRGKQSPSKNPSIPQGRQPTPQNPSIYPPMPSIKKVDSLLDSMVKGMEYQSIVALAMDGIKLESEIKRGVQEIEKVRGRPLLCYVSNVINPPPGSDIGITSRDHLPFNEMVEGIPKDKVDVDLFITTPGGSAESVSRFVNALRPRFSNIAAIIPYQAFSAGTLWVLSANEIIMDSRAVLGPIDPQVPATNGRYVPAQAMFTLVDDIQKKVTLASSKGQPLPLAWLEILRTIDKKELGATITSSQYAKTMAKEWIFKYKFSNWKTHSNGTTVTDDEKRARAEIIAQSLSNHEQWLSHGHGIRLEDLRNKAILGLKIENLEDSKETCTAVRRLWALFAWIFDKTTVNKILVSNSYFWSLQSHQMMAGQVKK